MKHLIIFAHPNVDSFNHAILECVVNKLNSLGESVEVRDLYVMNFNPCYDVADYRSRESGELPRDIKAEQDYIINSDKITFISPIWWSSVPAIMKGYFDRVFTEDFAYSRVDDIVSGLLSEKKFGMINTLSATKEESVRIGTIDAFNTLVDKGIFELCASPLCFHKFLYNVSKESVEKKQLMLNDIEKIIEQFVLDPNY